MKTVRGDFSLNNRLIHLSLIALLIGALATFVAKALLLMIALFTNLFYYARFSFSTAEPSSEHWGLWFILVPVVGGLLIGLMAKFGSEKIRGHGIPEALEAILFGKSIMQPKVAVLKPISSGISIGSGGPFGAEGPIIMTGGAVGSLIAQGLHLTAAERKTLLVAGAAAGMTAIFSTPISAILLAVELLLFEWKPRSLVPVGLACAMAAIIRTYFLEPGPLFPMDAAVTFSTAALFGAAVVGLIAGIFSSVLSKTLYKLEDFFHALPFHWMWWPALGGLVIGIGGYFEPRALGVGYSLIEGLLNGQFTTQAILLLLFVKIVIWLVALASGTSGGVLAPLLIFGCSLGALEAGFLPGSIPPGVWALISMGAVMGGMMRSPFTAILFAFELTHNHEALLPLLIASVTSYAFTVLFMKRSILTEKIARRGFDIFREYSVDPLERLRISEVMSSKIDSIPASASLAEVMARFTQGRHSSYPVIDENNQLLGLITGTDLEKVSQLDDMKDLIARDLIEKEPITLSPFQTCREAADTMAENEVGRILIVSPDNPNKLIGLMTRSDVFKARRHYSIEESKKERMLFT